MPEGQPDEAWVFPYDTDPTPRMRRDVWRPLVRVGISGPRGSQAVVALVDSGSEHIVAAPWLRSAIGVDFTEGRELELGIGGATVTTRFALDVGLRLFPPDDIEAEPIAWNTEVGFPEQWRPPWPMLLGQVGFFDQFTVTMQRDAQALAVDRWGAFDDRFGVVYRELREERPRFDP